ncbi:MAG: hypothetical protein AAF959_02140 [Cyanobacteria bacterium P01_D01_bin.56]
MMKRIVFWKTIPLRHRHQLPARPGLYAVKSLGRVLYVGRAVDLRDRWQGSGHHRYYQARNLAWPRLAYIELPKRAINRAERQLIERVNPPWNGSPVPKRAQWWKVGVEMLAAGVVCYLVFARG